VEKYLSGQGEHHGYAQRPLPPSLWSDMNERRRHRRISAKHAASSRSSIGYVYGWPSRDSWSKKAAQSPRVAEIGDRVEDCLSQSIFVPDQYMSRFGAPGIGHRRILRVR